MPVDGKDNLLVNEYLVRQGYAWSINSSPDKRYRDLLAAAEQEAKKKQCGLWGECNYERENKLRQLDVKPDNPRCIIKGNISEKGYGKTYLVPGCDNYERVKIDPRRGERYFCSQAEAQAAGFRKAENCP